MRILVVDAARTTLVVAGGVEVVHRQQAHLTNVGRRLEHREGAHAAFEAQRPCPHRPHALGRARLTDGHPHLRRDALPTVAVPSGAQDALRVRSVGWELGDRWRQRDQETAEGEGADERRAT